MSRNKIKKVDKEDNVISFNYPNITGISKESEIKKPVAASDNKNDEKSKKPAAASDNKNDEKSKKPAAASGNKNDEESKKPVAASDNKSNEKSIADDILRKNITILTSNEIKNNFFQNSFNFSNETKNFDYDEKDYFNIILIDFIEKNDISFKQEMVDKITKKVFKKGKRKIIKSREIEKEEQTLLNFFNLETEVYENYKQVITFLYTKDIINVNCFSHNYFFFDIYNYQKNNLDRLIKEYSKE